MARTRWLFGLLAIGCAALMPPPAQANISNGFLNSSDGSLYAMQTPANNAWGSPVSGQAFWNNSSYDGNGCNVGFVLTGTNVCGTTAGAGLNQTHLNSLAGSNYDAAAHFHFDTGIASPGMTFIFTKTAATADQVFWYDTSDSSGNTRTSIFTSTDAVGTTKPVTITAAHWGLEFYSSPQNQYFLSDGTTFNQFALFLDTTTGKYYTGFEDLKGTAGGTSCTPTPCSDYDYNDMVVQFAPVPEPATMFLGGLGLIAFGYAARRRLFGR